MNKPPWARNGEILNWDLHQLSTWPFIFRNAKKFLTKEINPESFQAALEFLEQATLPDGYIYKDVVNPLVVAKWPRLKQFNVLKIERNLTEVAYAMLTRGWHYPRQAAAGALMNAVARHGRQRRLDNVMRRMLPTNAHGRWTAKRHQESIIEGLIKAEKAVMEIEGEVISYEDLVANETALEAVLTKFYPGQVRTPLTYVDEDFRRETQRVRARCQEAKYQRLNGKIEAIKRKMAETPA